MDDDIPTLRRILAQCRTIAVVGLSAQWHRPSHFAASYLQGQGYRIVPETPAYPEVLGEKAYPLPIAQEAIAIGARCLWQQLGVLNLEADALARAAGLDSVMDRCVKIEHARLFGGLHWAGVNTRVISARRPALPVLQAGGAGRG